MDRKTAERLIGGAASTDADVALGLLWLRALLRKSDRAELQRFEEAGLKRIGLSCLLDGRRGRDPRHTNAIRAGKIEAHMDRLRAVIRSDHPYVTVKEHLVLEWAAALKLCELGEAETWALTFKKDRRGRGEGRRWWTITRAENEEDERI